MKKYLRPLSKSLTTFPSQGTPRGAFTSSASRRRATKRKVRSITPEASQTWRNADIFCSLFLHFSCCAPSLISRSFLGSVGPRHWEANLPKALASLRRVKGSLRPGVFGVACAKNIEKREWLCKDFVPPVMESWTMNIRKSACASLLTQENARNMMAANTQNAYAAFAIMRFWGIGLCTMIPAPFSS